MTYKTRSAYIGRDEHDPAMTADTVIVEDATPIDTGVLDPYGQKVYRCKDTVRFGFIGRSI